MNLERRVRWEFGVTAKGDARQTDATEKQKRYFFDLCPTLQFLIFLMLLQANGDTLPHSTI
jgi:hypothetical protein